MRDPKRIDPILDKIKALWKTYPDMRFGQLVDYIFTVTSFKKDDQFYIEDDILEKCLIERLKGK